MRIPAFFGLALASMLVMSACSSEQPPPDRPPEAVEQPKQPEQPKPPEQPKQPEQPVQPEQPEQPPEEPKLPPLSELPPLDTSCKVDMDCVPSPGCCPVPCTSNVININALPEAQKRLEGRCPEPLQCGSAGGCRTHEYLCVKGTCALVYYDDKNFRKRKTQ